MGAQGSTTINFGSFPGATDASVAVTGQTGITGGSAVEAWISLTATSNHSADEHWVDPPEIYAGNIVAGTGFTIYAVVKKRCEIGPTSDSTRIRNIDAPMQYGQWTVNWVWN